MTQIFLYRNNLVGSIPAEIGNLTALTELNLSGNQLTSLPIEIWNLIALEFLNLSNNQLTSIPAEIGNLTALKHLNLSGNQLTSLPIEIWNLTSLTFLGLENNQITSIPAEIGNLTSLTYLVLSGNQLTNVPTEIGNLTVLDRLYLEKNLLNNIPAEIRNLTVLTELYLNNNQLTSIPVEIGNLTSLTDLRLHDNQLTSIPAEIGNLTSLTSLYLHNNQLTSIPVEIGNLTALTSLYLSNNQLTSIPSEIENLTSLTSLSLYNNQLTSIPAEIGNLTSLTSLYLHNNQLTNIPSEIGSLTSLTGVSLLNNQLTSIPVEIGNLTALTWLGLSDNQLTNIPSEIGNLTALKTLDLENNQLTSIPMEIGNLTALTTLRLYDNQLTNIPDLGSLNSLNNIRVEENLLDFGALEASNLNWTSISTKVYSPQAPVLIQNSYSNNQLVAAISDLGTNNVYKWYKNGIVIDGASNSSIVVTDDTQNDYYCEISNPDFPDLILTSESAYLPAAVTKYDYEALVALYNATDGDNWTNNTNWLSEKPVSEWYGITESAGRVTVINLDNNNLVGSVPAEIGNLTALTHLILSNNQLTSIPDLGGLNLLEHIQVEENLLDFGALEASSLNWSSILTKVYSPQAPVKVLYIYSNNQSKLSVSVQGTNNAYQWYKNDVAIDGATNDTYAVTDGTQNHYYCEISNPDFQNLILISESSYFPAAVPKTEYEALVALYNATDGDNWTNNTNWLSEKPVSEWYGITESAGRVTEINLNTNNLLGSVPAEIGNLSALTYLNLHSNQLTSIPVEIGELTSLTKLYLAKNHLRNITDLGGLNLLEDIRVEGNLFDFSDLEATNLNWSSIPTKVYSPQSPLIQVQHTYTNSQTTVSVSAQGTNNAYQWYKNDEAIEGATNSSMIVTENTSYYFYCKITNSDFPDLTLTSDSAYLPAAVTKTEYDALVALYNATGGDNWTNNTNWLSEKPVSEWYGVDVSNGHVSDINLDDNNINGYIPDEIGNLSHLFMLTLSNGHLSGTIPSSIGDLTNLMSLGLSGNNLSGSVPTNITQMESLQYLVLFNNSLDNIPDLSSLEKLEMISVGGNNLTFEDIEPNIGIASMGFEYTPQATIGVKGERLVSIGNKDTLTVNVGGENNVYEWYKDGAAISNSNNDTLMITDFAISDAGEYYCKITNTVATNLTLQSDTFTLVPVYSISFTVTDKNGNLENATITLGDLGNQQTDASGVATFENVIASEDISYTVSASGHNDITGTTTVSEQNVTIDVQMIILSINDIEGAVAQIYPNPSNGMFNINLKKIPGKNSRLMVLDMNGKTIHQQKLTNTATRINLEGKHGTFILKIMDKENVYGTYKVFID